MASKDDDNDNDGVDSKGDVDKEAKKLVIFITSFALNRRTL